MARPYENIELDRAGTDGRIGRITLNRPDKMNALSQELLFELNDALHDFEADSGVRVIVVRGAGRAFSAGYDLAPPRGGADWMPGSIVGISYAIPGSARQELGRVQV